MHIMGDSKLKEAVESTGAFVEGSGPCRIKFTQAQQEERAAAELTDYAPADGGAGDYGTIGLEKDDRGYYL